MTRTERILAVTVLAALACVAIQEHTIWKTQEQANEAIRRQQGQTKSLPISTLVQIELPPLLTTDIRPAMRHYTECNSFSDQLPSWRGLEKGCLTMLQILKGGKTTDA